MTNHTPAAGAATGAAAKTTGPGTLITVAPTGAESQKSAVPALPVTLDELVTTAKECQAAGAAVIHVHIRDEQAQPTLDLARLTDTVAALRESTDLIVQLSTGDAATLVQAVSALPPGATWSATGIGRTSVPVMFAALSAGGHLRVGMEDTVSFARGRPVTGNAELVERAAALAELAQRPPMRPDRARALLGVNGRH